ncbi:MAG: FG-GAP-like repeat-containing protein [Verrucomicrobiota bacterium]
MNPSRPATSRTILYFVAIFAAVVAAFLYGYWQIRPRGEDRFTRLMIVGKNYYEQGNALKAMEAFEKALALQSTSADAQMNLANAFLLAGNADQALQHAQEVLALESNPAGAHYVRGCAFLRQSKFEEAVKELQTAKDIDQKVNAVSFQLGRAFQNWGKWDEAAEQFREVIQFEEHTAPIYLSAHYALGQVLVRQGKAEEATEVLNQYQKLLAERPNRPADVAALERCAYTQARVPFVVEQPASKGVSVSFADATAQFFGKATGAYHGPVGILDVNHRGANDLFVAEGTAGFRLLINSNASFQAQGDLLPATEGAHYTRCLVGDLNNDRFEDVIMIGDKGLQAFRFATNGAAIDATAFSNLSDSPAIDGALVDLDFTGKLDLLVITPGSNTVRVLRNLGNMYFKDTTTTSGVPTSLTTARQLRIDDWNNDDIMDVLVVRDNQAPLLLLKQRGSDLTETNSPPDWPVGTAAIMGDLNNDLRTDVVIASAGHIDCIFGGLTNRVQLPTPGFTATGLSLVDYDNDGWLDLCARGNGLRVWRNLGAAGFRETTTELQLDKVGADPIEQVACADFDNDGDTDFLLSTARRGLVLLRNDGGNANQLLKLRLTGNRSNASGLGVRIEVTSGRWRTIRTATELPIEIGVGHHRQLDSLNVHWVDVAAPSAEVPVEPRQTLVMLELLLPTGSCPYLYVWDGTRFRFVTDILGASPAGLPVAQGVMIDADPDEYVWLGDESEVQPRGDHYTVQITEELREVLYLDEAKLVVVDHPPGTEVHPTDKLMPRKPFPAGELITLGHRRPLIHAERLDGTDVTASLAEIDEGIVSPVKLRAPQLRGLAEPHSVILDFGVLPVDRPLVLALTGWLRFGGGMANVAASQDPALPFPFPILEVEQGQGQWQPVPVEVRCSRGQDKDDPG